MLPDRAFREFDRTPLPGRRNITGAGIGSKRHDIIACRCWSKLLFAAVIAGKMDVVMNFEPDRWSLYPAQPASEHDQADD